MNSEKQEERPLLTEIHSDEEFGSNFTNTYPQYSRASRGRAKYKIAGAANIISHWPDHWFAATNYCWLGIIMFCLVLFILYNGALAYTFPHPRHLRHQVSSYEYKHLKCPEVFMHIIVNDSNKVNITKYLPHIEALMQNYTEVQFNFVVVVNDTFKPTHYLENSLENNENTLQFNDDNVSHKIFLNGHTLIVEYTSLDKYLNLSPLKKKWHEIPKKYIPFLIRSISIWDKGGLAFNPDIIIPSTNVKYINKINGILRRFTKKTNEETFSINDNKMGNNYKTRKFVNNIQDIINKLENDSRSEFMSQVNLTEDETRDVNVKYSRKRKSNDQKDALFTVKETEHSGDLKVQSISRLSTDTSKNYSNENITSESGLTSKNNSDIRHDTRIKPLINPENIQLTIDLNGNLIATETACHAFIGTLFSESYIYTEEKSLRDSIVDELSLFCNGQLTSCKGVDMILL